MIKNKSFNDLITFSRASGGGRYNAQGKYEWLGNDEPRFDYDPVTKAVKGLLIEEQRTNLLTYSEHFDNASWGINGVLLRAKASVAVDGSLTALKLVEAAVSSTHSVGQLTSVVAGTTYTALIFAKAAERSEIILGCGPGVLGTDNFSYARFNLSTGQSSAFLGDPPRRISNVGNGWYLCSMTFTAATSGTLSPFNMQILDAAGANVYQGDGQSGLYIWGAQLEQGSFPTSYIPTKATFTARNSIGTYHDSTGVLRTAAANIARYDHGYVDGQWVSKGLLLEGQATNLLTYSEQFAVAAWDKVRASVAANAALASDGTMTADKLVEDSTNGLHAVRVLPSYSANTSYAFSVYAKAAERNILRVECFISGVGSVTGYFNLSDGSFTTSALSWSLISAKAEKTVGNIFRCSLVFTVGGTGGVGYCDAGPTSAVGSTLYTGDGTSGLYIWGAQLEVGDRPTSYIPTPAVFTSRASTKTYFDAQGVMRTAAVDEAAIDHGYIDGQWISKGLSVEGQATNLLLQSEVFDATAWGKGNTTVSVNVATAPSGLLTASRLIENTTTTTHQLTQNVAGTASTVFCASVFVKAAGRTKFHLLATNGTRYVGRQFDLTTGTSSPQAVGGVNDIPQFGITPIGGGWYYCYIVHSLLDTTTTWQLQVRLYNEADTYTGDGTSGLYIWGAQLEAGSQPTSYIPTTTAQVTRAADVTSSAQVTRVADSSTSSQVTRAADLASVNDLSGWYRQDEGTLVVEGEVTSRTPTRISADIGAGGAFGTTLYLAHTASFTSAAPTVAPIDTVATVPDTALTFKSALAMRKNDTAVASNGVLGSSDSSCEMPMAPNKLSIGKGGWSGSTNYLNGHIKSIKYLKRRVSNDELKALTV